MIFYNMLYSISISYVVVVANKSYHYFFSIYFNHSSYFCLCGDRDAQSCVFAPCAKDPNSNPIGNGLEIL